VTRLEPGTRAPRPELVGGMPSFLRATTWLGPAAALMAVAAAAAPKSEDFTRKYVGNMAGKYRLEMTLTREGSELSGVYLWEVRREVPLALKGEVTGKDLTLTESNGAETTGRFVGRFAADGSLRGLWSKPNSQDRFPFYFSIADPKATDDRPGRFDGSWGWEKDGASFTLDLVQRGNRLEGFYHAVGKDGAYDDRNSLVLGTASGTTAKVEWTSGHSGRSGTAYLTVQSNTVRWTLRDTPAADFFAPKQASLRRLER
jgi:hypothetical protein